VSIELDTNPNLTN